MALLNAPEYDERGENRKRNILIGSGVFVLLVIALALGGVILGHGWFFSNLPAEHRVSKFLTAIENKDFTTAYGIKQNDPEWQQHPQKYAEYPVQRFTEDWTTASPVGPITSHHVDISKVDGTGFWGAGIIVAVTVNGGPKRIYVFYIRKDGTLTDSPHELEY